MRSRYVWYYIYNCRCYSVGLTTNTVTYYNGTTFNSALEPDGEGDVLNGIGSGL